MVAVRRQAGRQAGRRAGRQAVARRGEGRPAPPRRPRGRGGGAAAACVGEGEQLPGVAWRGVARLRAGVRRRLCGEGEHKPREPEAQAPAAGAFGQQRRRAGYRGRPGERPSDVQALGLRRRLRAAAAARTG